MKYSFLALPMAPDTFGGLEPIDEDPSMQRWLVKVKSKRGLALRDVLICAENESAARNRVQRMYLLSDIATICPSLEALKNPLLQSGKR